MLLGLIKTLRPHQWFGKNLFVLAPLVFAKDLFRPQVFLRSVAAFCVFCLLSGAVYTFNDLVDADDDRKHPDKRHRPIASGLVPPGAAKVMAVVLIIASLAGAAMLDYLVSLCALAYLVNNLAYTFRVKHLPYLDVGSIALGFVLRVLAGSFAVPVRPSAYLIACTTLLSFFLGFGKRLHELKANKTDARKSLESYNPAALSGALYVLGAACVAVYVAWALDSTTASFFHTARLWYTTPFVLFDFALFVRLAQDGSQPKSPTDRMLKNVPFVMTLVLWGLTVVVLVYNVQPHVR